jgi:hypothetical protein
MTKKIFLICMIVIAFSLFTQPLPSCSEEAGRSSRAWQKKPIKQLMEKDKYSSSVVCGRCHQEIYNTWKKSLHAQSIEDPIFKTAYLEAYHDTAGEVKYLCLRCHAPITAVNNDYDLKEPITREGVSCDFCHTLTKINMDNKDNPFSFELGLSKRGPLKLKDNASPAHEVVYSSLHESSLLCAGCHEYKNGNGLSILSTYSEWKESPYAEEGKQCQDCHMPLVKGNVVKPEIKEGIGKYINLHDITGGHSLERLREAVKTEIEDVRRIDDMLQVKVKITNKGSGHMVPTGLPTRKLILQVIGKTPETEIRIGEIIYHKLLMDNNRKEILKDSEIFYKAKSLVMDNRLAPRESRIEIFKFPAPKGLESIMLSVVAKIFYKYTPTIMDRKEMEIEMSSDEILLPHL